MRTGLGVTASHARIEAASGRLVEPATHGVLISSTGLGCVPTAIGEVELEAFLEVFYRAVRHAETA
jgi:hypothetical protein